VNAGFLDYACVPVSATDEAQNTESLCRLEIEIMDCAERMLKIMDLLEVPGPYYLLVAFLNMKGLRVTSAEGHSLFAMFKL